nr:MAG TPA: hypothetical protein [Caudoviricetes sp.]
MELKSFLHKVFHFFFTNCFYNNSRPLHLFLQVGE